MEAYQPPINAPEFPDGIWLNCLEPLKREDLIGKITLIDIFDFTCINCLRTLPYLRAWQARYEGHGFQILGIHTPEFSFAHDVEILRAGVTRLGVHWPVLVDNDQEAWTSYANRYWPSHYLIDKRGKIRYRDVGEGGYAEIEAMIQSLLNTSEGMPDILSPIWPEDAEGAVCSPTSPELQLGSIEQLDFTNPESKDFRIPDSIEPDRIYLDGTWRVMEDGITLVGKLGEIALRYEAANVHAVLAPLPTDHVGLPFEQDPLYIQVVQDGKPLIRDRFGDDITAVGEEAHFRIDQPRLFTLVRNPQVESHELRLTIHQPGLTLYAFSFGTCINQQLSTTDLSKE